MLNMLLAIIMDVYTQVKGGIGDRAQTVSSQVFDMLRRFREEQSGHQFSLEHILTVLDPTTLDAADDTKGVPDETKMRINSLIECVDGLTAKQAEDVLTKALELQRVAEKENSLSISDATL